MRFLHGATQGQWGSLNDVAMEDFFLWGRAVTALFGTATVLLVYLAGRRWGVGLGLIAAALMAVMPSHVRESHFILTDTPMTFFVTATLVLALRAHERGTTRAFAAAGALAGLAAATRYNGGLVVIVPLLAALTDTPRGWMSGPPRRVLAILASAAAAFLAAAPYTVLALPEFLNGFAHLAQAYLPRQAHMESGVVIYLKHLRLTLGTVASVLTAAGLLVAAVDTVRQRRIAQNLALLVFPVAYLLAISDRSLIFGRYLLPALPFAALLAALGVTTAAEALARFIPSTRARYGVLAALVAAMLTVPTLQAVAFDRGVQLVGTARLAYEWIDANVPRGASIAIEARALQLPGNRYRVRQIPRVSDRPPAEIFGCYDYIVASAQAYGEVFRRPQEQPHEYTAYTDLFLKGQPVATFQPSPQHAGPELKVVHIASRVASPDACH